MAWSGAQRDDEGERERERERERESAESRGEERRGEHGVRGAHGARQEGQRW